MNRASRGRLDDADSFDDERGGPAPGRRTRTMALPARVQRAPAGIAAAAAPPAAVATHAEPGSPAAVLRALGPGSALDGAHGARLGAAMSDDFGDVQLHLDAGAARTAADLGARAFTVGTHIAFAAGEYRPGTPQGDLLLAHELAHVQQQRGGAVDGPALKRAELEGPEGPLEQEADQVAAAAVSQLCSSGLAFPARARSSLRSTLSLKRAPAIPTTHGVDQHAGTREPDATEQGGVWGQLNPNSTSKGKGGKVKEEAWDGANPDAKKRAKARADGERDLTDAMRKYLDDQAASIAAARALKRVPMTQAGAGALAGQDTGVQGVAALANSTVNTAFGASMGAAAATSATVAARATPLNARPPAKPGDPKQTLFDGNDAAQHAQALGTSVNGMAKGTAEWIATSTKPGSKALGDHHWSPGRGGDEKTVFDDVITRFLAAGTNQADTIDFEVFGLNAAGDGTVAVITTIDPSTQGGDAAKAEKASRWEIFTTMVHETLHLRTHPAFDDATADRPVMAEGFVEMFAKETNDPALTAARTGANEALRQGVEGKADKLDASVIPASYDIVEDYKAPFDHAVAIRDGTGGSPAVGENGVRAAFFQGHVELLGLKPDGTRATAPAAGAQKLKVPAGIADVDQLATATGIGRAQLVTDNKGIAAKLPATAIMAGCREHVVVKADDSTGTAIETRAQIAAQNGVSEADLVRANPGIAVDAVTNEWVALVPGARILIPVH